MAILKDLCDVSDVNSLYRGENSCAKEFLQALGTHPKKHHHGLPKVTNFVKQQLQEKGGVGGSRSYGGSPALSSNVSKKNTNVGGGGSGSYGGSHGLSSNSYKKNATVGGFGSSRGHVGSKSMGSAGGSGGNGKEKKTIPISKVDPMLDDISIQGRCISIWHSHRMNAAHDPYSLDLVLQDAHVIVSVIDNSGSAPLLFFNNNFVKLSGYTTWELIEKYNMAPDEYWPEELDNIVGKKCLFKLFYSEYNVAKNNHTYRCDSFSEDVELINHFKNNFIDTETDDEEPSDELAQSTTKKNKPIIQDSSDEHDLDMHTAFKKRDSTSSVEGSRSKKRKLIIDLDDVESEPKEEDKYWPEELDNIVGKKCLFKLFSSEYNVAKNNHTYHCDSFSEDVKLINHFKNNFIDTEIDDEEPSDELAQSTTKKNKPIMQDSHDEHDSDMHTTFKTRGFR
ncbi:replication protein A 70 kDa DNA-binding subunit B [Tanacetum coccineum]|uniref:Replication protein A 70 kDa DNA-binding subunit B n=1 Tax=Tanacetum coccineum TaxID=301880 RepID=A0ABQ4ZWC2_9ASTR